MLRVDSPLIPAGLDLTTAVAVAVASPGNGLGTKQTHTAGEAHRVRDEQLILG